MSEIESWKEWQNRPKEEKPLPKLEEVFSTDEMKNIKGTIDADEQSRQIDKEPTAGYRSSEVPFTPEEQKHVQQVAKKDFEKIQTGEISKPKPTKKLRQ